MSSIDQCRFGECLRAGQFVPYFQPIVALGTGKLEGFEILARWRHPDDGLQSPDKFIPAIEQAGLIGELTDEMLARAAESAASWQTKATLSLNISPLELSDRSLPQRLKRSAETGGLPLERLILEITEHALINDLALARSIIGDLKNLGVRIALDDLGTGYSSLHSLQALPFDEIKIDSQFVRQLTQQRESRVIVAAMIRLGKGLGLATVAEGVEEKSQAELLASLGCGYAQGWLFGYPVPAEEVPDVIVRLSAGGGSTDGVALWLPAASQNKSPGGATELVHGNSDDDYAQISVGKEHPPPKDIVIPARDHAGSTKNRDRKKIAWNFFRSRRGQNPPIASDNNKAFLLLLQAIERYAIPADDANREQFASYIREASEKFAKGGSGRHALNTAGEIQIKLKRHFWNNRNFSSSHKPEYQKLVSLLTDTVGSLKDSSHRAMSRLQEIEKKLHSATLIEDVRTNRALLEQCLGSIRKEVARQQSLSSAIHSPIPAEIESEENIESRNSVDAAHVSQNLPYDPVTGLPSRKQAEAALSEALNSGNMFFVVLIVAKGADTIYSHRGSEVGDSALYHFAEKIGSFMGNGDRLFRWGETSLIALVKRETISEVRREFSELSNMRLDDAIQVGSRMMWLPISVSWDAITAAPPYSSLVLKINQSVRSRNS